MTNQERFDALYDLYIARQQAAFNRFNSFYLSRPGITYVCDIPAGLTVTPADMEMIAKDGPVKPTVAPPPVAQEATSHAPLAGLTVLMERDHRFGLTASKPS